MKYYYSIEKNKTYVAIIDDKYPYERTYHIFFPPKCAMINYQIEIKNELILSLINGNRLKVNHQLNDTIITSNYIRELRKNSIPYKKYKLNKYPF